MTDRAHAEDHSAAHCQVFPLQRNGEAEYAAISAISTEERRVPEPTQVLSSTELARYHAFPASKRRGSYLAGRWLAKLAIARLAVGPTSVSIQPGVFGQPVVHGPCQPALGVSISHCSLLAGAIAFPVGHPLGLDMESNADSMDCDLANYFTREEYGLLDGAGVSAGAHNAALWTAKEALGKVLGCGLAVPMEVLAISAVEKTGDAGYVLTFRNFIQYRALCWTEPNVTISLALPGKTRIPPLSEFWATVCNPGKDAG